MADIVFFVIFIIRSAGSTVCIFIHNDLKIDRSAFIKPTHMHNAVNDGGRIGYHLGENLIVFGYVSPHPRFIAFHILRLNLFRYEIRQKENAFGILVKWHQLITIIYPLSVFILKMRGEKSAIANESYRIIGSQIRFRINTMLNEIAFQNGIFYVNDLGVLNI